MAPTLWLTRIIVARAFRDSGKSERRELARRWLANKASMDSFKRADLVPLQEGRDFEG